jgi:hypothetical protein
VEVDGLDAVHVHVTAAMSRVSRARPHWPNGDDLVALEREENVSVPAWPSTVSLASPDPDEGIVAGAQARRLAGAADDEVVAGAANQGVVAGRR